MSRIRRLAREYVLSGAGCVWLLLAIVSNAYQPGPPTADWLTDHADAQRTGWQKSESRISVSSAPQLKLEWKIQLDNAPRQMHGLLPPLIIGRVRTSRGMKQVAVVAGVSDNLYAVDADNGTLLWQTHFDEKFARSPLASPASVLCPGGQTATPVIAPSGSDQYRIYALSWDGRLRQVDAASGREVAPPVSFLPGNGKPYALNLWNGVIFTTTGQGCGGNPNLVYAYDLTSGQISTYSPGGGGMWGRAGPSVGSDGTLFTGTGDGILDPARRLFNQAIIAVQAGRNGKGLVLKDYFAPANADWLSRNDLDMNVTGPVFSFHGRELLAQSSKECRLWLLDTTALGGADHHSSAYATPQFCNEDASFESAGVWGALTTWEDSQGTRWILSPFWGPVHSKFSGPIEMGPVVHGAIAAFRLEDRNKTLELRPAWISRDLDRAAPPVVVNGVVFALSSGESTRQTWPDARYFGGARGRIAESTNATLYALDAESGRELWSSSSQIRSWSHSGGVSVGNGHVLLGTDDGILYSFSVPAMNSRDGRTNTPPPQLGR